jgi:hypothetical protein
MSSVYTINKGINQSIRFKGLKAQYIGYLAGGIIVLFILFVILYAIGINSFVCLGVVVIAGTFVFMYAHRLSNRYGEHGLMKKAARKRLPRVVRCGSRQFFY